MRKVVGRIPLARDEARSLSRSAPYSTWTCVSRAGAARSFQHWAAQPAPGLGSWRRRTCASGGSLLSTRCREGGGLRVFGVRRVRAVGELASPARLDEWATRLLGHLLVADVLGRLLAGRRALHKLLAEFLREVVVRGAADELLRLLPLTRGPVLFAEVVPKQRFLVGHLGPLGGLLRPPGLRLRRGLAGCGLLGVALGGVVGQNIGRHAGRGSPAKRACVAMSLLLALLGTLRAALKARTDLVLENLALRQQLALLRRRSKRPPVGLLDRVFWMWLSQWWARWREALHVVQPRTVIRWHRRGFPAFWNLKSRRDPTGRPPPALEIAQLVRPLAPRH